MTPVGRVDQGESRWYVDPADPDRIFESVTSILSDCASKPWLTPWAVGLAAGFAVQHHTLVGQTIREASPDAAVTLIKGEAARRRQIASDIGTYQHDVLEALLLDSPIPPIPPHLIDVTVDGELVDLDQISDGLLNFLDDFAVDPELAEMTVANPEHGYAGTLDLIATIPHLGRGLIDLKSGKHLDVSMHGQLGAYRNATEVWLDHLGNKMPMPRTDFAAVLHLRKDYERGYKLLQVPADRDEFGWFLTCRAVLLGRKALPPVLGRPLYVPLPDGSQPAPLIEDLPPLARWRNPFAAAGMRTIDDLALWTKQQLLTFPGIGPAAVTACAEILAAHELEFASQEVA